MNLRGVLRGADQGYLEGGKVCRVEEGEGLSQTDSEGQKGRSGADDDKKEKWKQPARAGNRFTETARGLRAGGRAGNLCQTM